MRARFLSFFFFIPFLFLSCTAAIDDPAKIAEEVQIESFEPSSWEGTSSLEVENGKGCLVFQTPPNPDGINLSYKISIDIDGIEVIKTIEANKVVVANNIPLGKHRISCTAYKSGSIIYASGSTEATIKSGKTDSLNLILKRQTTPEAPEIILQPQSRIITLAATGGANVSLTAKAKASGGELTVKWFKSSNADMSGKSEISSHTETNETVEIDPNLKIVNSILSESYSSTGSFYYQCEFIHSDTTNFGDETSSSKSSIISVKVKSLSSFSASYTGSPVSPLSLPALTDFAITETYSDGSTALGNHSDYTITSASIDTFRKVGSIPIELKHTGTGHTASANVTYKYTPTSSSATAIIEGDSSITLAQYTGSQTLTVHADTATAYTIYGSSPSSTVSDTKTYQWYKGNEKIANATDQTFTVPVNESGTFSYKCKVTYTPNATYAMSTTPTIIETSAVMVTVTASSTPTDSYTTWAEIKSAITSHGTSAEPKTISISGIIEADGWIDINGNIAIQAASNAGATICRKSGFKSNLFNVSGATASLDLGINQLPLIIDGNDKDGNQVQATGALIEADDGATISINNGVTLKNNYNSSTPGSAIHLENATLNMNNGTISNNTYTGTSTSSGGGGIYLLNSHMNMVYGTISQNTATQTSGGGIYAKGSTISISGGSIVGNTSNINKPQAIASHGGGGIYLNNTSLTISNGVSITGNNAPNASGGGIYNTVTGNLIIPDTSAVSGNTSKGETYGMNIYNKYRIGEDGAEEGILN